MTQMARWQRTLYFLGEAVIVLGLIWRLYNIFITKACPTTVFNDLTVIVLGLAMITLAAHPFGQPAYLRPGLNAIPALGIVFWLVSFAGVIYALVVRLSIPVSQDYWWLAALIPAALYFWFAIEVRTPAKSMPPAKAPPAPKRSKKQAKS